MKPNILYAFCGTGQGHMTKALSLKPEMEKRYNVKYLVSSLNNPLLFDVDFKLIGATFKFKNGALDIRDTFRSLDVESAFAEITKTEIEKYDFIINDHEPITAYASYHSRYDKICTLSHQASFAHAVTPRPPFNLKKLPERILAEYVLNSYAKNSIERSFGLHFRQYHKNIFYPLLREEILNMNPKENGECLVYLPKENPQRLLGLFSRFKNQKFIIYDPKTSCDEDEYDNVIFRKTDNVEFLKTLENCSMGIVNSGFELPSEMMYLRKELMTIPQTGQYEQECNAIALKELGIQCNDKLEYDSIDSFLKTATRKVLQPVSSPSEILDRLEKSIGI